jgi:F-type H+-transporting ATPase subunit gamma
MAGKIILALALLVANVAAFAPSVLRTNQGVQRGTPLMGGKENELRTRIASVGNTQKITEAMRLVAAAKVRRAQQAVLATRPFSETLQSVFGGLIQRLGNEDVDLPLLTSREVSKVTLVIFSGDRGLCGGYNSYGIKKTETRIKELKAQGVEVELVTVGKKPAQWFKKRETPVVKDFVMGQAPTTEEASAISEYLLSSYLAGETDSVEIIYTKFVSLIASSPEIRTMLPLSPRGIEMEGDELFQLTTKGGQFAVEKDGKEAAEPAKFPKDMVFEQDPAQILNAILPLYINGQVLRMLQECVASELAARMTAMGAASDNAKQLKTDLNRVYNRARQASVTAEILEICAGAEAANQG